jgi:hypothetical protein
MINALKNNIMTHSNNTLTAQQIRNLNIQKNDVLGFDYQWENGVDNNYLTVNGKRVISFTNSKHRRNSFDKIKRMGFGWGWKMGQLTDEENGIIQASQNGENPFAYSIICANPKYNKIVR